MMTILVLAVIGLISVILLLIVLGATLIVWPEFTVTKKERRDERERPSVAP